LGADYNNRFWKQYYFKNYFYEPPAAPLPRSFCWSDLVKYRLQLHLSGAENCHRQWLRNVLHKDCPPVKVLEFRAFFRKKGKVSRLPNGFPNNTLYFDRYDSDEAAKKAENHWRKLGIWY